MKKQQTTAFLALLLALTAGCFRQEIQVAEYSVPEMKTEAAKIYLTSRLRAVPGYKEASFDLEGHTITVTYNSNDIRTMNFEEAIALAGFTVNGRPANPKIKLPEGVK